MGLRIPYLACALVGAGLVSATPVWPELWSGFYQPSVPDLAQREGSAVPSIVRDDAVCIAEILDAQQQFAIPDNLLLAIGLQEAGRYAKTGLTVWPWTVNAAGEGVFFSDRAKMLDWVRARQAAGTRSIDVGCMQVNQKWHGSGFASLEQAVDPYANVQYAARYLRSLYQEEGDWWKAAGRYHSGTTTYQEIYLTRLKSNVKVAKAELDRFADRLVAQTAELGPATAPPPPVFWGATATIAPPGDADKAATRSDFSIYSNQPIKPLLPNYSERF